MPNMGAFSRIGIVRVPVSLTSASNQFAFPANLRGISNLFFVMENITPYDIRLEGTTLAQMGTTGFNAVTDDTGWPIRAYTTSEPRVSKMPAMLSAKVVSTPGNPVSAGADFTNCFLDLVYLQRT